MRIGSLITLLSEVYGVHEPTTMLVARALREAGLLSTGARGVNAPHMANRDVARLTLALMTGEPPGKVVDEYRFVASLQTELPFPEAGFISRGYLADGHTLEDAVTEIFNAMCDEARLLSYSEVFLGSILPPSLGIALDASRRVARIDVPDFSTDYINVLGFSQLDQLNDTKPMTLEIWEQIQAIEASSTTSFDSFNTVSGRGMRVVRSITHREIQKVCEVMQTQRE